MKSIVAVIVGLAVIVVIAEGKSYDGYKLVRFVPETEDQVKMLIDMSPETEDAGVSFWTDTGAVDQPVDVLVSPKSFASVVKFAKQNHFNRTQILIDDVQKLMMSDEGKPRSRIRQMGGGTTSTLNPNEFFNNFQRLNVMYAFMDTLARLYPRLVSVQSIGKSFEGRDMKMLKITGRNVHQGRQGSNSSKPIFFMDAGIHAREWAAPPTALFLAYSLASQYEMNDRIRRVVDDFEWHILPVANPDGYEYTHTNDRFWRKTRSRARGNGRQSSSCTGTDPNRNFGYHWRESGASNNPCADTFAGTKAFSEPETMNIANHIWNNRHNMLVYIALHAYSQLWLTPWGFTRELPPDYDDLYTKARRAADAVEKVYGTRFRVGSSTRILYAAAGGSDDWAKGAAGVPYAYTVELRPSGNAMRGFVLSPNEIRPCGQEMLAGFVQLATDVSDTRGIEVRSRNAKKRFRKLR